MHDIDSEVSVHKRYGRMMSKRPARKLYVVPESERPHIKVSLKTAVPRYLTRYHAEQLYNLTTNYDTWLDHFTILVNNKKVHPYSISVEQHGRTLVVNFYEDKERTTRLFFALVKEGCDWKMGSGPMLRLHDKPDDLDPYIEDPAFGARVLARLLDAN